MKGKLPNQNQRNLFRTILKDIINPKHELAILSDRINWQNFEDSFSPLYSHTGQPGIPIRTMVGLLLLKRIYNLGDETVMEQWVQKPYFQYFCGEAEFQWAPPCDPSDMVHFRKRIGEQGAEKILEVSNDTRRNEIKTTNDILVDTTAQEKNITYPTDSELWKKGLNKSQISLELGIYRGTVRRNLQMDESSFHGWINQPKHLPKKLTPYYDYVKKLLENALYLSASQVEDCLKENYTDLPGVNSKTVYSFVKSIREQHDLQKCKEKTVRQYQKLPEVVYGSEAQVDFGQYYIQTTSGKRMKVYFFAMVLSRSRFKYVYCQYLPFTTQTANYAHELAFEYFGGVPRRIIYDQDRVFIKDENLGDLLLTEEFSQFSQQYPFEIVFCRKADPE